MSNPLDSHGEHPSGDVGQLILLGIFLIVWVGDSFFLHLSTFLTDYLPGYIRIIFLVACLAAAAFLIKSSHGIVSHSQRSRGLVSTGAFKYISTLCISGASCFTLAWRSPRLPSFLWFSGLLSASSIIILPAMKRNYWKPGWARATKFIKSKQESGCLGCLLFIKKKIPLCDKKMGVQLPR